MRCKRFRLQFRVELDADEPGVALDLDDLRQPPVRRHAGKDQAAFFQPVAVFHVDLIAVAVAFLDRRGVVDLRDLGVRREQRGVAFLEEAAAVLGISEPTAKRWWAYTKAWLAVEIKAAGQ